MLESTESLLPNAPSGKTLSVVCVGEQEESLDELDRLLATLGARPAARVLFQARTLNPATYVGKGKLEEIKTTVESIGADAVVLDFELSPNQLRNIEKALDKPILDRPGVIIEIFSRHARTKESKTQVELARLQYLLPRLAHFWTHFERQRGGGTGARGMGEKQLEVDRRLVKKRIDILRGRLRDIEKERGIRSAGRADVLKVALVGYTNAGKSTLLNALTHSHVRVEDELFATLDPSMRALDPHSHPPIVAIDTVGFISRLPPTLVASFRSTLEVLHEADLLVHVVDASSAQAREQLEITEKVLSDLKLAEKPRFTVLNKTDLLETVGGPATVNWARLAAPGAMRLSALRAEDADRLRERILGHFRERLEVWEIVVPYADSRLEAQLHAHGSVEKSTHLEKGTFFRIRIGESWAKKLNLDRYRT